MDDHKPKFWCSSQSLKVLLTVKSFSVKLPQANEELVATQSIEEEDSGGVPMWRALSSWKPETGKALLPVDSLARFGNHWRTLFNESPMISNRRIRIIGEAALSEALHSPLATGCGEFRGWIQSLNFRLYWYSSMTSCTRFNSVWNSFNGSNVLQMHCKSRVETNL